MRYLPNRYCKNCKNTFQSRKVMYTIDISIVNFIICIDNNYYRYILADDLDVLKNAGKISKKIAVDKALSEFEKYRITQDKLFESDFDKFLEEII